MSEAKHTPGPWSCYDETGSDGLFPVTIKSDEDDLDLATMAHYARSRDVCTANAELMAVAPDLLRELQHLVRLIEPSEETFRIAGLGTLNGARAAIARATGKDGRP